MEAADRTNQRTGALGEKIALKFLKSRGYSIIAANYSSRLGEIDIIARHSGYIVFFEVKTRYSDLFGPPLSAITWQKQKHVIRNCICYLKHRGLMDEPCRIDAIGITLAPDGTLESLEHVRDAIQM